MLVTIDATTEQLRREFAKAGDTLEGFSANVTRQQSRIETALERINSVGGKAASTLAGFFAIRFGGNLAKDFIDAAASMEQMGRRLETMTGSAEAASEAMFFLRDAAQKQNVDLLALSNGYNSLLPAVKSGKVSMTDMRKILLLTNDNIKALGVSSSETSLVFFGLSQLLGSGAVTMENLKQVTDHMPGLLDAVASAMGKDVGAMTELIGTGKVMADQFKGSLIKALEANGGAAVKMADTYESASVRMANVSRDAFASIANSLQVLDGAKATLDLFSNAIEATADVIAKLHGRIENLSFQGLINEQKALTQAIAQEQAIIAKGGGLESFFVPIDVHKKQLADLQDKMERVNKLLVKTDTTPFGEDMAKSFYRLGDAASAAFKTIDDGITKAAKSTEQLKLESLEAEKLKGNYDRLSDAEKKKFDADEKALKVIVAKQKAQKEANSEAGKAAKQAQDAADAFIKFGENAGKSSEEIKLNEIAAFKLTAQYERLGQATKDALNVAQVQTFNEFLNKVGKDLEKTNNEQQKKQEESLKEQLEAQEKYRKDIEEKNRHTAENIQDEISSKIQAGLDGSIKGWQGYANEVKSIMFKVLAEIAAKYATQQLIMPILTGGGSVTSGGSGGGLAGLLGGAGSLSGAIDAFGAKVLPSVFSAPTTNFLVPGANGPEIGFGPSMPGTSLSGVLGSAATGLAVGSLVGGLTGGNKTGSSIGGTVGGLAGSAFGPVGTFIGSALGGALGGLFGGKEHPAAGFNGTLTASGALGNTKLLADHMDMQAAASIAAAVQQFTQGLASAGINVSGKTLHGGIENGGGFLRIGDGANIAFDQNNQQSLSNAINKLGIELAKTASISNQSLVIALKNIQTEGRSAQEVLADLQFAAAFDKLGEEVKPLSEVEQAVKNLDDQFKVMRETATRLGLDIEKLNAAQTKQLALAQKNFVDNLETALIDVLSPGINQIRDEMKRFQQQMKDAAALGLGGNVVAEIERLHQANLAALAKQTDLANSTSKQLDALKTQADAARDLAGRFSKISETYKGLLADLKFGKLAALNPVDRLAAVRAQVDTLGVQARLGNADAAESLAQLLPEFVQLSGDINGFNLTFAADQQKAVDLATAAKAVADRQVDVQTRLLTEAQKQSDLLSQLVNKAANPTGLNGLADAITAPGISSGVNAGGKSQGDLLFGGALTRGQFDVIRRQSTGYTGSFGNGGFEAFVKANPAAAQAFNNAMKALGIPGFAAGGIVTGGIAGKDSVTAMLMPGEAVIRARAVQALGPGAIASINAGRLPANDNAGLERRLDHLTNVVEALVRVTAASGDKSLDLLKGVNAQLSGIGGKALLEASR